jgi:hypothetical protein
LTYGAGGMEVYATRAAQFYILIYMVYEHLRESLISYIDIMIGIIINIIRYIFSHDIRSCYKHITPQKIRKTKQKIHETVENQLSQKQQTDKRLHAG